MPECISLDKIEPGRRVRVLAIGDGDSQHLRKLAVFGIIPGVMIEVLQDSPVYVLAVGYTQLALDREIIKKIIVEYFI